MLTRREFFFLVVPLILASCKRGKWKGRSIYLNSDSIGLGAHSTPDASNWEDASGWGETGWWGQLCAMTGAKGVNLSASGKTLENGNNCEYPQFSESEIHQKRKRDLFYFIQLTTNDNAWNNGTYTPQGARSTLVTALDNAVKNKGWDYKDFVLITPWWSPLQGMNYAGKACDAVDTNYERLEAYVTMIKDVAELKRTVLVDIYRATNNRKDLMNPYSPIHPLYEGHVLQAKLVVRELVPEI